MKVKYYRDECFPVYFLTDDDSWSEGEVNLNEEFIDEFNELSERYWIMQDELEAHLDTSTLKIERTK